MKKTKHGNLRQKAEKLLKKKIVKGAKLPSDAELKKLVHELEVHQIELELQNEELRQALANEKLITDKYVALYSFAPVGYYTLSTDGNIVELNFTGAALLGKDRKELINKRFSLYISDDSIPVFKQFFENVIKSESKEVCDVTLSTSNGSSIYAHLTGIVNENKEQCLLTVFDMSERKRAVEELQRSKDFLDKIINSSSLPIFVKDINHNVCLVNDAFCALINTSREKLIGTNGFEYFTDDQIKVFIANDQRVFNTGIENINEEIYTNKQGEVSTFITRKNSFTDTTGQKFLVGVLNDITRLKLSEEALKESEKKYRTLIEYSNDAIYLLYNNKFEVINNKVTEMFGYTLEEINKPGFSYEHLVAPKSKKIFIDRQEQFKKGKIEANKYEITLITKAGKEIDVEISDSFLDYKDGIANHGFIRDITTRKKQQELLMNAIIKVQEDEKYKFGKELHDGLGQVLISASMYLESLSKIENKLDDNKRKDLKHAQELNKQAMNDARRISHGLMITGIDEHGILYLVKQLCYNSGGPELTFSFSHNNIDEEKISTDFKVHLYRIIQELSSNILKHSKASKAKIKLVLENNSTLRLTISDNGKGFDTKKAVYGAGLRNIDQRITIMKGTKEISSGQGNGTKIIITIPL